MLPCKESGGITICNCSCSRYLFLASWRADSCLLHCWSFTLVPGAILCDMFHGAIVSAALPLLCMAGEAAVEERHVHN